MSALIWLAIVGVWCFVLIPMWLRHHDEGTAEQDAGERPGPARWVLARRGPRTDAAEDTGSTDVVEETPDAPDLESLDTAALALAGDETVPETASVETRPETGAPEASARVAAAASSPHDRPERAGDQTAHTVAVGAPRQVTPARRVDPQQRVLRRLRRQRLVVLVAAVPVTITLAAVLGGMWIVVQLLVDAGLALYLLHLRRVARAERRLNASRAARDRRIAAERAARHAARAVGTGRAAGADGRAVPSAARQPLTEDTFAARPRVRTGGASRTPEYTPVRLSHEDEQAAPDADTVALTRRASPVVADPAPVAEQAQQVVPQPAADPPAAGARVSPSRSVAGRPNVRPPTSRPGRVQVNPPGTHGGLTPPPAAQQPAGASSEGDTPAEQTDPPGNVHVLRPAVGS